MFRHQIHAIGPGKRSITIEVIVMTESTKRQKQSRMDALAESADSITGFESEPVPSPISEESDAASEDVPTPASGELWGETTTPVPQLAPRRREATGDPRLGVEEVYEPLVDLFDEGDYILLIAEIPGVSLEQVSIKQFEDILLLSAKASDRKYRQEIVLPTQINLAERKISLHHGVLQVKLPKKK